ncbi:MAG: hypothetical protein AB7V46_22530 [Thermomicrobiales bacterium]
MRTLRSAAAVMLCLCLTPSEGEAKGLIKRIKRGFDEIISNPIALRPHDGANRLDIRLRDLERNISSVMLPVTARTLGILPWDLDNLQQLSGVGIETVAVSLGDWVARSLIRRSYGSINPRDWTYFGSGSPVASFIRGAYSGLGISTIGLGIVLPTLTGGNLLNPHEAALIMAETSLALGAVRATAKVIANRAYGEKQWLDETKRMAQSE